MNNPFDGNAVAGFDAAQWVPPEVGPIADHQTDLPRIAKGPKLIGAIEAWLP